MFTIGVDGEFSAAHFHRGASSRCERIHGHNYRVEVLVGSPELQDGMVVDFGVVRRALKEATQCWDHHLLNEVDDFAGVEPTTEHLSRLLFDKLSVGLPGPGLLKRVTVWETGDCWASYTPDKE